MKTKSTKNAIMRNFVLLMQCGSARIGNKMKLCAIICVQTHTNCINQRKPHSHCRIKKQSKVSKKCANNAIFCCLMHKKLTRFVLKKVGQAVGRAAPYDFFNTI
jgi:hypothetical protein